MELFNQSPSQERPKIIGDIRRIRDPDSGFYNALRWIDGKPRRLYHVTDEEGLKSIADDKAFRPPGWALPEIYMSAAPEESLGEFAIVCDSDNMIDKGFSPRTAAPMPLGEIQNRMSIDKDRLYETERGYIVPERHTGYIDKRLYEKYEYPETDDRFVNTSDEHTYTAGIDTTCLEPYGEIEVSGNPPYKINLTPLMQQTFGRIVYDEVPLSTDDVEAILYPSGRDLDFIPMPDVVEYAASVFDAEMISIKDASDEYVELRGGGTVI